MEHGHGHGPSFIQGPRTKPNSIVVTVAPLGIFELARRTLIPCLSLFAWLVLFKARLFDCSFFLSFSPRWRTPSPPARHVRQSDCAQSYAQCNVATMNFLKSRSPSSFSTLHALISHSACSSSRRSSALGISVAHYATLQLDATSSLLARPFSPRHQPSTPPPLSSLMPSLHQLAAELPVAISDICMISIIVSFRD